MLLYAEFSGHITTIRTDQTMYILNIIMLLFWVVVAIQSTYAFYNLRDQGVSRSEIIIVAIILLGALNISRGLISLAVDLPVAYQGQKLLEYFQVGSSMFQLLLCTIVLEVTKKNKP